MTVRRGEKYVSESDLELVDHLGIDGREVFGVLTDEAQDDVVEDYNEVCAVFATGPVESVDELPDFVARDWFEWLDATGYTIVTAIIEVLDEREMEYIHLYDEPGIHTVIELTPESNPWSEYATEEELL